MPEQYPGQGFARMLRDGIKLPVVRKHWQIWPKNRALSDDELMADVAAAIADGYESMDGVPKTPSEAIAFLSDCGLGRFIVECPECGGSGMVEKYVYGPPPDGVPHSRMTHCGRCGGSGEVEI